MQSDSGPHGLTRVSVMQSDPLRVIPGLIRDLLPVLKEMLNQVQHDSLEKVVIRGFFIVIPTRIKKRSKPGLQSDSGPQGLTRVSVMQSDPFAIRDLILTLNTQNLWISNVHRDIHPNPAERKESICKKK